MRAHWTSLLSIALIAVLLASCARRDSTSSSELYNYTGIPQAGSSTITGGFVSDSSFINGTKKIGTVIFAVDGDALYGNSSMPFQEQCNLRIPLSPGKHHVAAQYINGGNIRTLNINFTAEPNKDYFIKVNPIYREGLIASYMTEATFWIEDAAGNKVTEPQATASVKFM